MYSDQPPMEGPSSEPYYPQHYDYTHAPYHTGYATSSASPPAFPGIPGPGSRYPPHNAYYLPMMMTSRYGIPDYTQQRMEMTWQSYAPASHFPHHNSQNSHGKRGRPGYSHYSPNSRQSRGFKRANLPLFFHSHEQTGPAEVSSQISEPRIYRSEIVVSSQLSELCSPNKLPLPASDGSTVKTMISSSPEETGLKNDIEEDLEQPISQSSPALQSSGVLDQNPSWCISHVKPEPASAFPLTISPRAKPPHSIIENSLIVWNSKRPQTPKSTTMGSESQDSSKIAPVTTSQQSKTVESADDEQMPSPLNPYEPLAEGKEKTFVKDIETTTQTRSIDPTPSKKVTSWAALLRGQASGDSISLKGTKSLPTSSVVGFSIPAEAIPRVPNPNELGIVKLLTAKFMKSGEPHRLSPRGLLNLGNMCFANIILQGLVYTYPFWSLLRELKKLDPTPLMTAKGTPLLSATLRFVDEFEVKPPPKEATSGLDQERSEKNEAFVPQYLFEALKANKRFDTMRGGQQEDAEEFLGFFLDAIEEEMLGLIKSIDSDKAVSHNEIPEREEEAERETDGWIDVGKHNRKVITRAVKSIETPISRIFGGHSRSTLRRPGASDSATVEGWRHLGLDIQSVEVRTIEDALNELSRPEIVQVSSSHGTLIDGSKQDLIDGLPPILILHLKRFNYDPSLKDVIKQRKVIHFGSELVIPKNICSTALKGQKIPNFKLYAVLYHHGVHATGGHYTLDVLHPNRKQEAWGKGWREGWIHIDDELISDTNIQDIIAQEAGEDRTPYLLFYKQSGYQL